MKKVTLILMCIVIFSMSLIAEENYNTMKGVRIEEISLDDFIGDYLPDYTMQKRIPLEGIGRAYAVAKESGDIVAITEIGEQFKVHFFDIEGNLKWEKVFDKKYDIKCIISDNGETITIYSWNNEYGVNIILNKGGNILFEETLKSERFIPSPDGSYLYKRIGVMGNYYQPYFGLYHKDGSLVNISGFDNTNIENVRLKFVTKDLILANVETMDRKSFLHFFKLENTKITLLWKYQIPFGMFSDYSFDQWVKTNKNRILIQGYNMLYVFDFMGNLLYSEDNVFYQSLDLISQNRLILQRYGIRLKVNSTKIINLFSKAIQDRDFTFKYGRNTKFSSTDYDDFKNVLSFNGLLLFSIKRFPHQKRTFYTSIININNWNEIININHQIDFIDYNEEQILIFEKHNENPEVVIMRGKK